MHVRIRQKWYDFWFYKERGVYTTVGGSRYESIVLWFMWWVIYEKIKRIV